MNKKLLSVLSLSLLVSFAPGCFRNNKKSTKKKTVKKVDVLNSKVLDIAYDEEDEENSAWAQADTDNDEEEVVTKF